MKTLIIICSLALALSACPMVSAQEAPGPPCIPINDGDLGPLIGSWSVEWHYRTAPGKFAISEATAEIILDLDGCVLAEHFSGILREIPFTAVTMISQTAKGQYDRIRIDSEHGKFTHSSGKAAEDSVIFTWERDLGTRVLRTRHIFTEFQSYSL